MSKLSLLVAVTLSISALGHPTSRKCGFNKGVDGQFGNFNGISMTGDYPQGWQPHSPHSWAWGPHEADGSPAHTAPAEPAATVTPTSNTSSSTSSSASIASTVSDTVTVPSPTETPASSSSSAASTASSSDTVATPSPTDQAPSPAAPAPAPASTPGNGDDFGGGNATEIHMFLDTHNSIRAQHNASALAWNATVASKAKVWADNCVFRHSGGAVGPYGENLGMGGINATEYNFLENYVRAWASEASTYNPNTPEYTHFTQLVWKSTSQLGCAYNICPDGKIPDTSGPQRLVVCEYYPAGNFIGQTTENVQV